jgi:hypothetical protein
MALAKFIKQSGGTFGPSVIKAKYGTRVALGHDYIVHNLTVQFDAHPFAATGTSTMDTRQATAGREKILPPCQPIRPDHSGGSGGSSRRSVTFICLQHATLGMVRCHAHCRLPRHWRSDRVRAFCGGDGSAAPPFSAASIMGCEA